MKNPTFLVILFLSALSLAGCSHLEPKTNFGHYSAAESYFAKAKYEKAIEEYQAYLNQEPQGNMAAIAYYYIAKSKLALGDKAAAEKSFEDVITLFPKSDWADFAKTQLETLAGKS